MRLFRPQGNRIRSQFAFLPPMEWTGLYCLWICFALWGTRTVTEAVQVLPRGCGGSIHHVRIAVGPDPSTSMIVSFASISSRFVKGTIFPVGGVRLGISSDELSTVYMEEDKGGLSARCYNVTTLKRGLSNDESNRTSTVYWSPFYHHVLITGLEPSTKYYYQPVFQANREEFQRIYGSSLALNSLRNTDGTIQGETKRPVPSKYSPAKNGTIEKEGFRGRTLRRQLLRWGPYDGSASACPSKEKIRSFQTAPSPSSSVSATFAVLGDLGQFPHSQLTMEGVLHWKEDIDAAILAGDIAYTGEDHRRWDTFLDFLDDYMAFEAIPLQICPGNHDIDKYETSDQIFLAYETRFRMPHVKPPQLGTYQGPEGRLNTAQPPYPLPYEYGNSYYSWKYASAHFIMVNAYASMDPGSQQRHFIETELQRVNRNVTPWVIVVIHTPLYNTFGLHLNDPQILAAKEHLEPLFVQYRVNIVFSGHIHAYSRSHGVTFDKLDPKGPVHITVGAGGRKCEAPFRNRTAEEWVAVRDATMYGFGMLRIHNSTIAEWDWIHTSATDDDRKYNQVSGAPEEHLDPGRPDHVYIVNQYFWQHE